MARRQIAASTFDSNLRVRPAALVPLAIGLTTLTIATMAQGQTLTVLHTFTGGGDGGTPYAGLTILRDLGEYEAGLRRNCLSR
jgi:hypothetical protein